MSSEETNLLIITSDEANDRLDKILAQRYKGIYSRTYFQMLIDQHCILVNGDPVKKRTKPQEGDEIQIQFILTPEIDLIPEAIPLTILYEDDYIIAVNKPPGLVVHPAAGNWTGTFVNALLYHCKQLSSIDSTLRPGIVHRLDKDTSGVLVAAKTSAAQQKLIELFASRKVLKEYLAICIGNPGNGSINAPIGRHPVHRQRMAVIPENGREAITHCKTLAHDDKLSYVHLILETGRTHQIRVHMQHRGTPVLGDSVYGSQQANAKYGVKRQLLHAHRVSFKHPITGVDLVIEAPIPEDIASIANRLKYTQTS